MPLLNVKQCLRQEPVQLPAKAFPWGSISLGFFSSPGLWESILQMLCMMWSQPSGGKGFTIWHFQKGPKISQKHQKFHESDNSADVPEIFNYISSNISRVEAAGFPGVRYSEKLLHLQILTRQTSKNRQFFTWGNPDVRLGEQITEKPLSYLEAPAWASFLLWSVISLWHLCSESEWKLS